MNKRIIGKFRLPGILISLAVLLVPVIPLDAKGPRYTTLEPGEALRGTIRADQNRGVYRTYVLDVPATASGVKIAVTEAEADLDLFLRYDEEMEDYSQADFYSETDMWLEELHIYKGYETWFPAGRYYLDVVYQWSELPRRDGVTFVEIPYELVYEVFDGRDAAPLEPDETVRAVLDGSSGYMTRYAFDIPRRTRVFRVDVLDTPGDVDLFLAKGDPAPTRDDYDVIVETYLGRESAVVTADGGDLSGTWYLTALEASETEYPVPLDLILTLGADPPEAAPAPAALPVSLPGMDRLRTATVQLVSPAGIGSGCLVSPQGHILTNHHVVTDDAGRILDTLVVAISARAFEPPLEDFTAEVVGTSPDDDLALLRITGDRWGRPLPAGFRFPFWTLDGGGVPAIGDELMLMGYPWMGSGLSRSHFTLTRGTVSGGETTPRGFVFKTDAVISGGSSGGAVSSAGGLLLGLPTFVVSDDAAQLTFFVPVDRIPRDWRHLLRYE